VVNMPTACAHGTDAGLAALSMVRTIASLHLHRGVPRVLIRTRPPVNCGGYQLPSALIARLVARRRRQRRPSRPSAVGRVGHRRQETDRKVKQRNNGGRFTPDRRLYVGGRDRSKLVGGLAWQVDALRTALGDRRDVPVHAVLFVFADWPLLREPFVVDNVHVVWPRRLAKMIAHGGSPENVGDVSERLASKLPPAS
jgi:hypothetical protein